MLRFACSPKDVDSKDYELLVIDNNSTDETKQIVAEYKNSYPSIKIYYYLEPKVGLSHARNRAIKESHSEYIAYIDDDGIAYPDWIYQIIKFTHKYPHIYAFGGPSYRYAEIPIPKWVPSDYGTVDLGEKEKEVAIGIIGCNMMFKKSLLEKLGGFNPNLGMNRKTMRYGEEDEIFTKMIKLNLPIMYGPHIKIKHLLQNYKLNMFWRLKSKFAKVRTELLQKNTTREGTNFIPIISNLLSYKNIISFTPIENKAYNIILALDIIAAVFYAHVLKVMKKFQKK
jgi:glycosyltransferase involved in cell wall biosynthesis